MTITLQHLSESDIPALHQAFLEAFSDYVQDASHVTETYIRNRSTLNGVVYENSVGIFDHDKLVGFILVALDDFCGEHAAYDGLTGIIKPYREQGLAKAMFDFVLPGLHSRGARSFYLEVIKSNQPAIRAYEKSGFKITRELDAYEIHFEDIQAKELPGSGIEIRPVPKCVLMNVDEFFDWQPSWGNTIASIQRIPDEVIILGAHVQTELVGFLVYYPLLRWILNLAVHRSYRRQKIGTALIAKLKDVIGPQDPPIKIINIEHADKSMIEFLNTVGKMHDIGQYEMKLDLQK